jgi:hypothetical protein
VRYALFEKGGRPQPQRPLGRSDPRARARLNQYGDNGSGEVQKELRDARKKAG